MTSAPEAWRPVLASHEAGEISTQIALARLLLADPQASPDELLPRLAAEAPQDASLRRLQDLARAQSGRLGSLRALVAQGLDPGASLEETQFLFDRLARTAPEAGVAFYSLGDPALLREATSELACLIEAWIAVIDKEILDFGCGIGRLANALAERRAQVLGVDLSAEMIAKACRRAVPGTRFIQSGSQAAAEIAAGHFDAIVAADSLPYLVRAGEDVVRRQLGDFARWLRPGGDLLVFNWSYRGDLTLDVADAHRLGEEAGFAVLRSGEHPFAIWDASAFQLRRLN